MKKICPTFNEENTLWNQGFLHIAGIDEVGRGCFAGPLVIGAVIFPPRFSEVGKIKDSKMLTAKEREKVAKFVTKYALCHAVSEVSVKEINNHGMAKSLHIGYRRVLKNLSLQPQFILIDAFYIKHKSKKIQKPIVKGDALCTSIAAASVIAKVYRDNLMRMLAKDYKGYYFEQNKGYGTKAHQEAIKKYGLSDLHRTSFNLKQFLA